MASTALNYDPHDDEEAQVPLEFDRDLAGPEFFMFEQIVIQENVSKLLEEE